LNFEICIQLNLNLSTWRSPIRKRNKK